MIKDGWNGFNVLHHAAGRVGALDAGFVPMKDGKDMAGIFDGCKKETLKLVYLLGADEFDMNLLGRTFVIYQGHHGDDGAQRADVILPGAAYTEKDATYVNLEGRAQRAKRCVFPPGQAKDDWAIIRALSDALGKSLPYNTIEQLRARMAKLAPSFAAINQITSGVWQGAPKNLGSISGAVFEPFITNFYMTDPISRASRTMGECVREMNEQKRAA
jgi:NADH-quinone oxidoreductase subunit G